MKINTTRLAVLSLLLAGNVSAQAQTRIHIQDADLTQAKGWENIAPGVQQHIDAKTGAISRVSSGEEGRRFEQAMLNAELAQVRRESRDAMARNQSLVDLNQREQEILAELKSIERPASAAKGSVNHYDGTANCANVLGEFFGYFSKSPRVGGGVIGSVSADTGFRSCIGFECIPFEDAWVSSGYTGYAKSGARASNSGGAVVQNTSSGVQNIYAYPHAIASRTTPNVADSSCTLRATGQINTTLVTTPYQSCYLFRIFSHELSCAAIP